MNRNHTPPDAGIASRCRASLVPGAYTVLPRSNRVLSALPNLTGGSVQVLAAPPLGALFVEHEIILSPEGKLRQPADGELEHFMFVLEGSAELRLCSNAHNLKTGGFAWLPSDASYELVGIGCDPSRVLWLRRRYVEAGDLAVPEAIISSEQAVSAIPEDTYVEQHLVPYESPAFDMGMNLLSFEPGIHFGSAESHIMEHGLYMLSGRGIYWLNGDFHEVQAGDFIYMAPYCPQFFYATGWERARYLLYKDVNRDYSDGL